jgi:hypothetical protein
VFEALQQILITSWSPVCEVSGNTYLPTYSMEQSHWETKGFSASQEIPRILGNQRVHNCFHKCLPPGPIPQSISPGPRLSVWIFRNNTCFYGEELLAPRPSWRTTPCRLPATAYSIYSQLPSILEAIPPSATWGRTMLWWQETHLSRVTGDTTFNFSFYYCSFMEYNYSLFQFRRIKLWNY